MKLYVHIYIYIHSFITIQPWWPGLAGTRAQSCDRYGSGTLHPGHVLGGSLPLLSPYIYIYIYIYTHVVFQISPQRDDTTPSNTIGIAFQFPAGNEISHFPQDSWLVLLSTVPPVECRQVIFSRKQGGRRVKLTTHPTLCRD